MEERVRVEDSRIVAPRALKTGLKIGREVLERCDLEIALRLERPPQAQRVGAYVLD